MGVRYVFTCDECGVGLEANVAEFHPNASPLPPVPGWRWIGPGASSTGEKELLCPACDLEPDSTTDSP